MGWAERLNRKRKKSQERIKRGRGVKMGKAIVAGLKRFFRATGAILIAGAVAQAGQDPKLLLFAPLIQAVAKFLREKCGIRYMPL